MSDPGNEPVPAIQIQILDKNPQHGFWGDFRARARQFPRSVPPFCLLCFAGELKTGDLRSGCAITSGNGPKTCGYIRAVVTAWWWWDPQNWQGPRCLLIFSAGDKKIGRHFRSANPFCRDSHITFEIRPWGVPIFHSRFCAPL
jgi:hypothetical protein